MVKRSTKRYIAVYVLEEVKNEELIRTIEGKLSIYLGVLYPTKVMQVRHVKNIGKFRILLFVIKRGFDPHILIPILSLIKINNCWIEPILMSGTLKSLQESLKARYPKLAQG